MRHIDCKLRILWMFAMAMTMARALPAADSGGGVPLPGLESDPPNTVIPQDCAVSVVDAHVSVDISVSTSESKPALLFEGPLFSWNGPSEPYPDRHFPELHFRVDGEAATPEESFEAFIGKQDISMLLKAAGMDPWAIARNPASIAAHSENIRVLKVLTSMGAVEKSQDDFLAKWQARRILRTPLKAVPLQHVQYDYTARPTTSVIAAEQIDTDSREKRYCISPAQLRRLIHPGTRSGLVTVSDFTIPTGIDGNRPKSAALTMSAGLGTDTGPRAYLFLCGPHNKPISSRGSVSREHADIDDSGALHVLRVVESAGPNAY
jgi:hypothetical protein